MNEVFLDTSFAIALSSVTDRNHLQAVKLANQIETKWKCGSHCGYLKTPNKTLHPIAIK